MFYGGQLVDKRRSWDMPQGLLKSKTEFSSTGQEMNEKFESVRSRASVFVRMQKIA